MVNILYAEDIVRAIKKQMARVAGDEAAETAVLELGSEILDISVDSLLERLHRL